LACWCAYELNAFPPSSLRGHAVNGRLPQVRSLGTGAGAALMLLAGGAAEALLLRRWRRFASDYRSPKARRALLWGGGLALVACAVWLAYLASKAIPLARALNLQRWLGEAERHPAFYLGILGWYAWPAWPLAAWALYRSRRQWRTPGIVLPAGALLGLLGLYAFDAHAGEERGLVLLLPLALLGASGLFGCGAAANACCGLRMLFGFIALVFWVYWSAHDLGQSARLAARLPNWA
jgi:hypothetical protein